MKYIAYYRVSTQKQGQSGLGLEAQRAAVLAYLGTLKPKNGGGRVPAPDHFTPKHKPKPKPNSKNKSRTTSRYVPSQPFMEFKEVESGKRQQNRPRLTEAIQACRAYGAVLVIAKLDRLSRDAHFLLGLEKSGIDFVCADMPFANRLTIGVMALVAEEEGRAISLRTKAALAAAKRRGVKLGGDRGAVITRKIVALGVQAVKDRARRKAQDIAPIIAQVRKEGAVSLRAIATGLNERDVPTARGQGEWSARQVARVLERL